MHKKVTQEDLDIAARYIATALNIMLDGNIRRVVDNAYTRGYRKGFNEGVEQAAKELLAR